MAFLKESKVIVNQGYNSLYDLLNPGCNCDGDESRCDCGQWFIEESDFGSIDLSMIRNVIDDRSAMSFDIDLISNEIYKKILINK